MIKALSKIFLVVIIIESLLSCGIDPLTGEESPDKSQTVFAYTKRFGDKNTYVSIKNNQNNEEMTLMKIRGIVGITFDWKSDRELNIQIPNDSIVEYSHLSLSDLKIKMIKE